MSVSRRFSAIDFARLPLPAAIETLDYAEIYARMQADFQARWDALRVEYPDLPEYDVGSLETDPIVILLQTYAYENLLLRAEANDKLRATFLATAVGADLDNIAARYATLRLDGETDRAFRERILLAYEALSTAGTYGGYEYHARSANVLVADAAVYGPESGLVTPGQSLVVVLSSEGLGSPSASVLLDVETRLNDPDVRALTDEVIVQAVAVVPYTIEAKVKIGIGPSAAAVKAEVESRVAALISRRRIGARVSRSAISGALHLIDDNGEPIVSEIDLISPVADLTPSAVQVASCSTVLITVEVIDG